MTRFSLGKVKSKFQILAIFSRVTFNKCDCSIHSLRDSEFKGQGLKPDRKGNKKWQLYGRYNSQL